jgi:phenylpyruvate tautomerase PptA (4-oxalocrotonate tautomerase family)
LTQATGKLDPLRDQLKQIQQAIKGFGKKSSDAFVDFIFAAKDVSVSFGEMVASILKDLALMPLYTLITQDGALSRDAKATLAMELTTLHSDYAGVPKNWVRVVFQDYAPGNGFTAGEPAATAALTLLTRAGRPPEYKRELIQRLWKLFQTATGVPDDQIVIGIQDLPASQAMDMGKVMPDIASEYEGLCDGRVGDNADLREARRLAVPLPTRGV